MKNLVINNISRSIEKQILVVFAASILLAISAKVAIPLGPVPFTLQTITVIFLTILLGKQLGLAAVSLYLLEGICGLPVFASASWTSTGYLLGFLGSVCLTDSLYKTWNDRSVTSLFFFGLISILPIFLLGLIVLALFIGIKSAFWIGVYPFIFSELAKCFALALFLHRFLKKS